MTIGHDTMQVSFYFCSCIQLTADWLNSNCFQVRSAKVFIEKDWTTGSTHTCTRTHKHIHTISPACWFMETIIILVESLWAEKVCSYSRVSHVAKSRQQKWNTWVSSSCQQEQVSSVLYKNIQRFLIANNFYLHLCILDARKALRKLCLLINWKG